MNEPTVNAEELEDAIDLDAYKQRRNEETLSLEEVVAELEEKDRRSNGAIIA